MRLVLYHKHQSLQGVGMSKELIELTGYIEVDGWYELTKDQQHKAMQDRIGRLEKTLRKAIEWDGQDDEGVDAIWLKEAEEALEGK